jgi:membrane glycosyltransferase
LLNLYLVWWLLPVAVALLVSVPLSVYSSRVSLGRALRRWRLFLIPEETDPPEIIQRLRTALEQGRQGGRPHAPGSRGIAIPPAPQPETDFERVRVIRANDKPAVEANADALVQAGRR